MVNVRLKEQCIVPSPRAKDSPPPPSYSLNSLNCTVPPQATFYYCVFPSFHYHLKCLGSGIQVSPWKCELALRQFSPFERLTLLCYGKQTKTLTRSLHGGGGLDSLVSVCDKICTCLLCFPPPPPPTG